MIELDCFSYTKDFFNEKDFEGYKLKLEEAKQKLFCGGHMTDWLEKESTIDKEELAKVKLLADEIKQNADLFVVVGIGGSYLGARAVIDALGGHFKPRKPEIVFAGFDLSSDYIVELLKHIDSYKSVYVNVISKSGSTMETNIAFDLLLKKIKEKHKEDYLKRVIITTDKQKGVLRQLCSEGYRSLVVPENIGGRYSVLSSVGLLAISVAGNDVDRLLSGIDEGKKYYKTAEQLAVARDLMFKNKYFLEAVTVYDKRYEGFAGWYQQLFAESQGKDKKGILPFANLHTTNLHSIGQFLQEGTNFVFETVLKIPSSNDIFVESQNLHMKDLESLVVDKVAEAHQKGKTPSLIIKMQKMDEIELGTLIYILFLACAIGGYLLNINPFDQPGVEEYKKLVKDGIKQLN